MYHTKQELMSLTNRTDIARISDHIGCEPPLVKDVREEVRTYFEAKDEWRNSKDQTERMYSVISELPPGLSVAEMEVALIIHYM